MIYVRIEVWPHGNKAEARVLQELVIANVGGTPEKGNYFAAMSHSTTYKGNGFLDPQKPQKSETWKTGDIKGFNRNLSPFHLVLSALKSLLR